jgi:hypothetical protein
MIIRYANIITFAILTALVFYIGSNILGRPIETTSVFFTVAVAIIAYVIMQTFRRF